MFENLKLGKPDNFSESTILKKGLSYHKKTILALSSIYLESICDFIAITGLMPKVVQNY